MSLRPRLKTLLDEFVASGIYCGHAERLLRAGAFEHCFKELYFAATKDGDAYREHEVTLEQLNNEIARLPYARTLGFPLSA